MSRVFISATGTGVGKTYAACAIIEALGSLGIKVGACKAIETGVNSIPQDANSLLKSLRPFNPNFKTLSPFDICAYTFSLPAAPFCADSNSVIKIEEILKKINQLESLCDILIIEGAGGLMVPITKDYYMIDLASELKAQTLLVCPSELGSINSTLLSLNLLESKQIPYEWCINLYRDKESFDRITKPYYDASHPMWWTLQEGLDTYISRLLSSFDQAAF